MSSQYNKTKNVMKQTFIYRSTVALIATLAIWFPGSLFAVQVKNISTEQISGEQVQIQIELDETAPEVGSFTIDNPPRLSIDIPGTTLDLTKKMMNVNTGVVSSVRALESGGRTRIVVNLTKQTPYEIRAENNMIFVQLNNSSSRSNASSDFFDGVLGGGGTAPTSRTQQLEIDKVDFRRGMNGEGQVEISLSDPSAIVDLNVDGGKIIVDFVSVELNKMYERRMDVIDFATPVSTIDTYSVDNGSRMVITPINDQFDYIAYQAGSTYQIEVKPITKQEAEEIKKDKFGFKGEKLSLNFQNIEVRAVLQLIADFTGLNIVASDTVSGNITLRLKNVPWDQALDIILKTRGLGKRQNGNVVLVAPNDEIAAREKQELESRQQLEELAPLSTKFIRINYAKAADISSLLKSGEKNSILSERGQVTIDERTNTLMVMDTSDKIDEILSLVEQLDVPVKQVMIEARIVIASDGFSRSLGVQTGVSNISTQGSTSYVTSGSSTGNDTSVTAIAAGSPAFPALSDRLNVNLPAAGATGKIALAILGGSDYLVDLELSAMQQEGTGELVSNPRVITSNQKTATIEQGVEIPYQEASSSGATSVSFKKAVLSLNVTPQITPDNRVVMDLSVTKDNVSTLVNGGIPAIDTRQIKTQVLVNNGDTVVLGGIYENEKVNSVDKVPLLGDIPLIGALFRRTVKTDNKSELLIFITPKILKEGMNTQLR